MVKFNSTARPIGTYRCTFESLDTEFTITDKETGKDKIVWRWVFQDVRDSTTVGEVDCIQNVGFPPRSNNLKFMTGMLGRVPTEKDDTDDLIGRIYDVTWGPNQGGRTTITAVTRVADELADAMPVPDLKGAALP
jgi:hypothetical protein